MCKCLEEISKKAEARIKEGIETSYKNGVEYTEPRGFLDNEGMMITGGTRLFMNYYVPFRRRKVNGELEARETKKKVAVFLNHCPFCGEEVKID